MQDKTISGKYLLPTGPTATEAEVVRMAHSLGADLGLSDAEKARLAHYEAHREEMEVEEIRRRAAERPLRQYERGLLTVEELVEQLIPIAAGLHEDEVR